jgi:outer membrane protein TolC
VSKKKTVTIPAVALAVVLGLSLSAGSISAQSDPDLQVYSLARALQVALDNSETIRDTEMDLEVAKHQVREAYGRVLPDVSANVSYSRNLLVQQFFLPAAFFDPTAAPGELTAVRVGSDNTWTLGVNASQPLFEYTAFIGLGAAGLYRGLQSERVRGSAQSVVTSVRLAYFTALLADESVRLTEESVERVRKTLEETQAMNRAGLASEYDVLRLEVQLGNLEPNLRRARIDGDVAKRNLLIEMGLEPDAPIELEGRLNEVDLADISHNSPENAALLNVAGLTTSPATDFDELLVTALLRRSDVRQLQASISVEEARLQVEKSEYFPKLSLFSNYNLTAQQDGSPIFFGNNANQRVKTSVAGVQVQIPIFSGFARNARVQQANARIHQNEFRLDRLERQTASELRTWIDNTQEAQQRAASQRRAVEQAQRGYEIASAQYNAGLGSQLQITDAEVALRQSEFNYAQAVFDYLSARAGLEASVGVVPDEAGTFAALNDR